MKETSPIPYGRHHITQADIEAVVATLQGDYLTQGEQVQVFEQKFAQYVGSQYAVAVSNGTAALHLCAIVLGVDETQDVITSPITFAASANCIRYCGGTLEFVDIDPDTLLMDLNQVKALLQDAPLGYYNGMVVVDFAGYPAQMELFRELADAYNLWIIEDSCHAPGGYFTDSQGKQQRCGNGQYADLAIFSFHPVKHIACGEGGMITTNRKDLYEKLLRLRTHGITKDPTVIAPNQGGWYYEMQELGYNYRLTDIQCALGISQLDRASPNLERRRILAQQYDEALKELPIQTIKPPADGGHAYHLYIIQTTKRRALYDYLRKNQIFTQVHYIPVHWHPYYQSLGYNKGAYPHAEKYYAQGLSIPMFPTLTDEEQGYVVDKIKAFYLGSHNGFS